ncbi:MAG: 30S ribosomal protein S6 [Nitrospirae bacterium]|nr:MAG: 30S ribosomal protein S6 [Nitrospirota bacterium]
MRLYESVSILRTSLTDEEVEKVIERMKELLERNGATVRKVENLGKRKLAYEIEHERKGTYICLQFEGPGTVVEELERFQRLEDAVLKFLTIRLREDSSSTPETREVGQEHVGVQ